MTDLSKIQLIAVTQAMTHADAAFTNEKWAAFKHCSISLALSTIGEPTLIADIQLNFGEDESPEELRINFFQDENRKLTGEIEVGFFGTNLARKKLDFIRGW